MEEFFPFFLVLFAAVFFSMAFRRFHMPWVIALILGGMLIGPHGFNIFQPNDTIEFLSQIGLVFLMFVAGLEVRLSTFRKAKKDITLLSLSNGLIPFFVGVAIGLLFGFGVVASILLGIIFISSSVAVIIPSLEKNKLLGTRLGNIIVASTVLQDAASLVFLSILLQTINPITTLPLPLFYVLLFVSLLALRWILPKVQWFFSGRIRSSEDFFQQEFRAVFLIMIGTVIIFELLGLHPIIAGFFSGLVLSGSIQSEALKEKIRVVSYGLFIPIFFIVVGTQTNLSVFTESREIFLLVAVVVLGSIGAKFVGGWLGGRAIGFSSRQSAFIGVSTIPRLSTTLAVVFAGVELGLLPEELITAMVVLSIVTVFIAPILSRIILGKDNKNMALVSQDTLFSDKI